MRHFGNSQAKRHTLGELIDRYLAEVLAKPDRARSRESATQRLLWWKTALGAFTLADVTPAIIAEAIGTLETETVSRLVTESNPSGQRTGPTVNRYIAALSVVYTYAIYAWQWAETSPIKRRMKRPEARGRTRHLSTTERTRLLDACRESRNPYLFPIVLTALSTGLRKGEILNLRWDHVALDRRTITVLDTKNGTPRTVAIGGPLHDELNRLSKIRRLHSTLLFPRDGEDRPTDIQTAWDWAVKRTKLDDFHFHDLRHSCATMLLESGATLAQIAEVLGHRTLQMVKRYAHLSEPHAAAIVTKMNDAFLRADDGGVSFPFSETGYK